MESFCVGQQTTGHEERDEAKRDLVNELETGGVSTKLGASVSFP